jgi:hypothetical protein
MSPKNVKLDDVLSVIVAVSSTAVAYVGVLTTASDPVPVSVIVAGYVGLALIASLPVAVSLS